MATSSLTQLIETNAALSKMLSASQANTLALDKRMAAVERAIERMADTTSKSLEKLDLKKIEKAAESVKSQAANFAAESEALRAFIGTTSMAQLIQSMDALGKNVETYGEHAKRMRNDLRVVINLTKQALDEAKSR